MEPGTDFSNVPDNFIDVVEGEKGKNTVVEWRGSTVTRILVKTNERTPLKEKEGALDLPEGEKLYIAGGKYKVTLKP